ncbi:hypothetical protein HUR95_00440 [Caldalkalibacillus thermarum TA2.A1]|nr:hypothetical protein [Caldalkalibacillus thermarum]QZT33945.1 hypothetical protein HUR95_00440 [Caldalkalibacillus thermarum TA2.A1]
MATVSFDKKMIIKDDTAANILIHELETPKHGKLIQPINIRKELQRGSLLLKKKYSR